MKVIFCGRKPYSACALQYIVGKFKWDVQLVIVPKAPEPAWAPPPRLADFARSQGIPVATLEDANIHLSRNYQVEYGFYLAGTDLLISYLFPHRITSPLLKHPKLGCINFHPGPLPEYAGFRGYNFAILEGATTYGCTAHFMDETFDTGDIIKVRKFEIDPKGETALSLERRTQMEMLLLFREICCLIDQGIELPRVHQEGTRYATRQEFEAARLVGVNDDTETISKKIRAFWYPPYPGATIHVGDRKYTLISDDLLYALAHRFHEPFQFPDLI